MALPIATTVDAAELREKPLPVFLLGVALYAEEDILRTPRMEVVVYHEVEYLTVTFADLIHELREGYLAADKPLAGFAHVQVSQTPTAVTDYETGDDVSGFDCLVHQDDPFPDPT